MRAAFYMPVKKLHILGQENVANGATCTTSISSIIRPCSEAFDGFSVAYGAGAFIFVLSPVGEWIHIDFNNEYTLGIMRIMEGVGHDTKNIKGLDLAFSDGSTQQVKLYM